MIKSSDLLTKYILVIWQLHRTLQYIVLAEYLAEYVCSIDKSSIDVSTVTTVWEETVLVGVDSGPSRRSLVHTGWQREFPRMPVLRPDERSAAAVMAVDVLRVLADGHTTINTQCTPTPSVSESISQSTSKIQGSHSFG